MNRLKSIFINKKFLLFSALLFGGFFFGVAEAQAVGWDAKPGTVGESVSWYGVSNGCTAAQAGNTRFTMLIDWQDIPNSSSGYYVDYKRTYDFNDTTTQNWIWNKFIANPNTKNLITDGSDFADSPFDGGVNGNTRDLEGGFAYYVRVYNVENATHYYIPGFVGMLICGIQVFPTQPTIANQPACMGQNGYNGSSINWSGRYDERLGHYVDISTDNFSTWYAKAVGNVFTTDFSGFNGYMGVSGPLTLQPNTTYYVRVFNGGNGWSTTRTFTTPSACAKPTCSSASPMNYTVPFGTNNHTVSVQTANATYASFAFYPQGQAGSVIWIGGVDAGGGVWNGTINLTSFGAVYGQYIVDIYISNANWIGEGCGQHPNFVREAVSTPTCTIGATPDALVTYEDVGSHNIDVAGVANSTTVKVAIWSDENGQDDLIWYDAVNQGGGLWRLSSSAYNYSSHPGYSPISVHVYLNNTQVSNQFCDTANFERQRRPAVTLNSVVPNIGAATCTSGAYTANLSWTGQARPAGQPIYTGYIVDASTDAGFTGWWNKTLSTTSTTAPTGFGPYSGVSGTLVLNPNTTYYFRVYNDSHSNIVSVNVPSCGTVNVELDNQSGTWTLNHQSSSFTLNGTGTQLNVTVPSGTYTLTAHPLAGYNSVVAPATVVVP